MRKLLIISVMIVISMFCLLTDYPWGHTSNNYYQSIKKVTFEGPVIGSGSFERMLFECAEVESFDLTGLQTGSVTDMTDMFAG